MKLNRKYFHFCLMPTVMEKSVLRKFCNQPVLWKPTVSFFQSTALSSKILSEKVVSGLNFYSDMDIQAKLFFELVDKDGNGTISKVSTK